MDSHAPSALSAGLLESYRQAVYTVVEDGRETLTLRVGHPHLRLDDLLDRRRTTHAALITACNPRSRLLPRPTNRRRMRRLQQALSGLGLPWIQATNSDPAGAWPHEAAVLVLDPSQAMADALAARFDQWGYLWLSARHPVELRIRHTSASPYRSV